MRISVVSEPRGVTQKTREERVDQLLSKLGIARNRIADIQRVPWEQLLEAQTQVTGGFTPVLDGKYLPHHPFDPAAPVESRDVPVIISTTPATFCAN